VSGCMKSHARMPGACIFRNCRHVGAARRGPQSGLTLAGGSRQVRTALVGSRRTPMPGIAYTVVSRALGPVLTVPSDLAAGSLERSSSPGWR